MPAPLLTLLRTAAAEPSDADLLGRFVAARDEAAFAELVRRHGPTVHRFCRRLVGRSAADDAFQATFLVLACRAGAVRKAGSVGSWLVGVAGRVARQMRRRDGRAAGVSRLLDNTEQPAHTGRSPEVAELVAILDDELARLPDDLRAPVVLCLVHGRTQEQAAAELGGSVRTLRRRLDRAKAVLRLRLERRGVVPAVAAGLVTSVGSGVNAVPPELVRRAVDGVFAFLAGGPTTPAVSVAKGVVGSMATLKVSATVGMISVAAVLIGLGVGGADDRSPVPMVPLPTPTVEKADVGGPVPDKPVPPQPPAVAATSGDQVPGSVHRTTHFLVSAPTAVMARVIGSEAEFHRTELALKWFGTTLPHGRDERIQIRYTSPMGETTGVSTFRFGKNGDAPALAGGTIELRGDFMRTLSIPLPHEVLHVVLAEHFGQPLPRWADEGIALTAESAEEQAYHDVKCRELLNVGRCIRLKVLLRMMDYPQDLLVLYAQGHSVVRFLASRGPKGPSLEVNGKPFPSDHPVARHRAVIDFLQIGMSDGKGVRVPAVKFQNGWDAAAYAVYGFRGGVDELEEAWLEWLKTTESKLTRPAVPKPSVPRDDKSDLIPPTKLPGGGKP